MNPPYSRRIIALFCEKLCVEYAAGRVTQAIAVTNNYTDTAWFHRLAKAATAICFTSGRIAFINKGSVRRAPINGQAFFYIGPNATRFVAEFDKIGLVLCHASHGRAPFSNEWTECNRRNPPAHTISTPVLGALNRGNLRDGLRATDTATSRASTAMPWTSISAATPNGC
jgi:hypothetical protein